MYDCCHVSEKKNSVVDTVPLRDVSVIPSRRSFVQRLINLLKGPRRPYHNVRLKQPDLQQWKVFSDSWNGTLLSFLPLWNQRWNSLQMPQATGGEKHGVA